MTNITIEDFHHDVTGAEEASKADPVLITEDGTPRHASLACEQYHQVSKARAATSENHPFDPTLPMSVLLSLPEGQDFDLEKETIQFAFGRED